MIEVLCHSSIRIEEGKIIHIDPFKVDKDYNDADYVFCTHTHYDHFSPEDIEKVRKEDTKLIITKDIEDKAKEFFKEENIFVIEPENEYQVGNLKFLTTYAYNVNKAFHPKENKWVGYIIEINHKKYYIAGDTDNIKEIQDIKCDIAFIPIGGTYTMDYEEAAQLAKQIDAKQIIPTHYGSIVGDKTDAIKFKGLVQNKEVKILI